MTSEWIALFGGTFDPPHLGHREAVHGLLSVPGVKETWVLPTPDPPYKPCFTSLEHRLAMLRLSIPDSVKIDLREIERAQRNPSQPIFTYDTLQEVRRSTPHPAFVIGVDQLEMLPHWHRFPDLLPLAHWIVLTRKPQGERPARQILATWEASGLIRADHSNRGNHELGNWRIQQGKSHENMQLKLVPTEAPELSSTAIRDSIVRTGQAPEGSLMPEVLAYLKQYRLYGMGCNQNGK